MRFNLSYRVAIEVIKFNLEGNTRPKFQDRSDLMYRLYVSTL